MMNDTAIRATHPSVVTIREQEDGSFIATDKDEEVVEIDEALVNAWVNPNAYKQSRADAYPTIEAQLDSIFHNGIDGWKGTIKAIKDKHPKGTK